MSATADRAAADRAAADRAAADRAAADRAAADQIPAGGAAAHRTLRIGEVAELTGTTPRTIRYYEEIGLLAVGGAGGARDRAQGKHRCYTEADVERIREIVRLRDLLGLSLEQLSQLLEAESARAHLRRELSQTESPADRRRILHQLGGHIATQLDLVRSRIDELQQLAAELEAKQVLVAERIAETGT